MCIRDRYIPEYEKAEVEGYINLLADNYGSFGLPQIERLKIKEKAYRAILYGIEEFIAEKDDFLIEDLNEEGLKNYIETYGIQSQQFRNYFKEALRSIRESRAYREIKELEEKIEFTLDMLDILLSEMVKYHGKGISPRRVLELFKQCDAVGRNENAADIEAKLKLVLGMEYPGK